MSLLTATDRAKLVTTNGAVAITLYSPVLIPSTEVVIKNAASQLGTTTVDTAAGTIDGAASTTIVGANAYKRFKAINGIWTVIGSSDLPSSGVPLSSTVTGTDPIQIAGDSAAHDLSVPRTWRIKPGTGTGKALVWNGSAWAESTDFGTQNVVTTGTLGAGATTLASLIVTGNLTVNGTTTTVNSTVVDIGDRVVHFNYAALGVVPAPANITGLVVERGSADGITRRDAAALLWEETTSTWRFSLNTAADDTNVGADLALRALKFSLGASTAPSLEYIGGDKLGLKVGTTGHSIALYDTTTLWGLFNYNSGNPYFQAFGFPFLLQTTSTHALRIAATGTGPLNLDGTDIYFRSPDGATNRARMTVNGFRIGDGNAVDAANDLEVAGASLFVGEVKLTHQFLRWQAGVATPTITIAATSSDVPGTLLTILGQPAGIGSTDRDGGGVSICGGAKTGTGLPGPVRLHTDGISGGLYVRPTGTNWQLDLDNHLTSALGGNIVTYLEVKRGGTTYYIALREEVA